MASPGPLSSLVFAELYEAGDAAFVTRLLEARGNLRPLLGLIERWKKDRRPWARTLKVRFITDPALRPDHRVIVKRLFKQAWHDRDHELMAHFAVVADRWIRRRRAKRFSYSAGVIETAEVLRVSPRHRPTIFSTPTAHYLRRRAWRYFRRLGFADPAAYLASIPLALASYSDDDVRAGENLLDNWTLMHACFGRSAQLAFDSRHTNVAPGASLAELEAAPMFERHWSAAGSMGTLVDLLVRARCRPVRVWAIQLLRRHHVAGLASIDADSLLRLLDSGDADVAGFGAELLQNAKTVGGFPVQTWMRLLETRNPSVVTTIVNAFRARVVFDRLTLAQAAELATRAAVPVATLGLEVLSARPVRSAADRTEVAGLASARCVAIASAIAAFALPRLNATGVYSVEQVVPFFDSPVASMRDGAFAALDPSSPAAGDPAFWARLFESPYDDVRAALVSQLSTRGPLPGVTGDALDLLWRSVLLNVHRGGRAKLTALRLMSEQIEREPSSAGRLLPVFAIAIRSVRAPEARHGLAAIVRAVERVPALAEAVAAHLPELQLDGAGAAR